MSFLGTIKGWFGSSSGHDGHGSPGDSHGHDDHSHEGHETNGAHDSRWNGLNEPVGYIPGATPGFAQIGQGDLKKMSLALKIQEGARMGFDFVQLDIETISEIMEPDLNKRARQIQDAQKVFAGVHGPVQGQTALDLGTAVAPLWHRHHQNLLRTAYGSSLLGAKYILFHTSAMGRPGITFGLGEGRTGGGPLFAFNGTVLGQWIQDVADGNFSDLKDPTRKQQIKDFKEWTLAMFIENFYRQQGRAVDPVEERWYQEHRNFSEGYDEMERRIEDISKKSGEKMEAETKKKIEENVRRLNELQKKQESGQKLTQQEIDEARAKNEDIQVYKSVQYKSRRQQEIAQDDPFYKKMANIYNTAEHYGGKKWFYEVFSLWTRSGSTSEEKIAYHAVAKFMFLTRDPLWIDIVEEHGPEIDPDDVVQAADNSKARLSELVDVYQEQKNKDRVKKMYPNVEVTPIKIAEKIIAAVCAKYIQGHLFTGGDVWGFKGLPEAGRFPHLQSNADSAYRFCEKNMRINPFDNSEEHWPMQIFIENEQPVSAPEGELRLMRAKHHIALVKAIDDGKLTSFCIDFEHMMVNMIDPLTETADLKPGDGKYVKMVHMNSVVAFRGAHGPIRRLSRDMDILYRFLFNLRRAGMKNAYIIWEMGSFGVEQSATAYRAFINALNKDLDPEELKEGTPEYDELVKILYGLDDTFAAQQAVAIRSHAYDPLKGLLMHPEEEHGFLSGEVIKKGTDKLATWARGHLK